MEILWQIAHGTFLSHRYWSFVFVADDRINGDPKLRNDIESGNVDDDDDFDDNDDDAFDDDNDDDDDDDRFGGLNSFDADSDVDDNDGDG